jgi:hypothetical protein
MSKRTEYQEGYCDGVDGKPLQSRPIDDSYIDYFKGHSAGKADKIKKEKK